MDARNDSLLPCDVVMKGGITSGVVYPPAVSELAKTYRFINVGGTSAGAIAAACTAAAELRRRNGDPKAFTGLDELSQELGAKGFILSLFQPTAWTWPLFKIALSFIGSKAMGVKILTAIFWAFVCFWPLTILALLLDVLLGWRLATIGEPWFVWVLAAVTMLVVFDVAWFLGLWWSVAKAIPGNYLGMCNGSGGRRAAPALTDWLTAKIDTLAGTEQGSAPLTFGALWGTAAATDDQTTPYAKLPPSLEGPAPTLDQIRGDAKLNLEMITTCVTLGRPFRLPIVHRIFFIDPADASALFPKRVADWLKDHAARPRSKEEAVLYKLLEPLKPLPPPHSFPVVVAARMSLSFPVLLGAVKLHAIDYKLPANVAVDKLIEKLARDPSFDLDRDGNDLRLAEYKRQLRVEPCWFSDGGLTHNFPIQFFDGPLPQWPTFAIDLDALPDAASDQHPRKPLDYIELPRSNIEGIAPTWNRIQGPHKPPSLSSFVGAIFDTLQNWTDNTQSQMPGYRDRIVHVELAQDEGGLNLDMPAEVVKKLADRGRAAGEVLTQAFAQPPHTAWHWLNHRFVRYRNFMALFEQLMTSFHDEYTTNFAPGLDYPTLIDDPPSYDWDPASQKAFALAETIKTDALGADLAASTDSFLEGAPHPQGELTVRPVL